MGKSNSDLIFLHKSRTENVFCLSGRPGEDCKCSGKHGTLEKACGMQTS